MTTITLSRAVVEQALEALESVYGDSCDALHALRAALAQQAEPVEPVAWMVYTEGGTSAYVTDNPNDLVGAYRALPLYTAPPQRKPLTEEEIKDCLPPDAVRLPPGWAQFARAVERKVRGEERC